MKQYVLDSCALLAFFLKENGHEKVSGVLREVLEKKAVVCMHGVNLLEVYYDRYKAMGKKQADAMLDDIKQLQISIRSGIPRAVLLEAGRLKASYRISLGDSFALALASVSGGALLTCDHHEFDVIEKSEPIQFHWIR